MAYILLEVQEVLVSLLVSVLQLSRLWEPSSSLWSGFPSERLDRGMSGVASLSKSRRFCERRDLKVKQGESIDIGEIEDERNRRKLIGQFQGRRMGIYDSDPEWDDVIPIPQDDGENPLAAIAYTDEYAEGKPGHIFSSRSPGISD